MSKPFRYWTRLAVVSTLSASLFVSPAWAGRFLHRQKDRCQTADSCMTSSPCVTEESCQPCEVAEYSPMVEAGDCGCGGEVMMSSSMSSGVEMSSPMTTMSSDCGCGSSMQSSEMIVESSSMQSAPPAPADPAKSKPVLPPVPKVEAPKPPKPEMPAPKPEPKVEMPPKLAPPPVVESAPIKPPAPPAPKSDPIPPPVAPAPAPKPVPPPPVVKPTAPPPVMEVPPSPFGSDDSGFGTTDDSDAAIPMIEPETGLFDTPEPATPADDATKPADSGFDDLFGGGADNAPTPAPTPAPSADPFGLPPATEAAPDAPTDIFAPEKEEPSIDNLFGGSEPATISEEPAPATSDDLFGSPKKSDNPIGDLFSTPEEAPDATKDKSIDDLFNSTTPNRRDVEKSLDQELNDEIDLDSLFGTPTSAPAAPADKSVDPTQSLRNDLDDLFSSQATEINDGFQGAEMRIWVDNTGNFTINARLVTVNINEVKLVKDNGRTSTVPVRRLSPTDLKYVRNVVAMLQDNSANGAKFVQLNDGAGNTSNVTR